MHLNADKIIGGANMIGVCVYIYIYTVHLHAETLTQEASNSCVRIL